MDFELLERKFGEMGARLRVRSEPHAIGQGGVSLDIAHDPRGEYFEVRVRGAALKELQAVDVRPDARHLLLLVREDEEKQKFLCGHDERHWFVAAVPEVRGVTNVRTAMEALKPGIVRAEQARKRVKFSERARRKTAAYVRQGEWFFLPEPGLRVEERLVLHNEPLRRGAGKPHVVQDCYREGGEEVYVSFLRPNGVNHAQYKKLLSRKSFAEARWTMMRRNPAVYVRGFVRHDDHATIFLHGWHRVVLNTETQAKARASVAFLD